jgi:hypothetical protein
VDTFIAVSDQDPANKSLLHEIQQAYSAVAVTLLAKAPFSMPCHLAGYRDVFGPGYPLVQWRSIEACYDLVEHEERRRQVQYNWMIRVRTDVVFFQPITLPLNITSVVYVPGGGMARASWAKCCNDHMLICPRHLCAPYYRLLRNFENSSCKPPKAGGFGLQALQKDGTIQPPVVPSAVSCYIKAAYGGSAGGACGLVREFGALYAITHGVPYSSHLDLGCEGNLGLMWRRDAAQLVSSQARSCAMKLCLPLQKEWRKGMNSSTLLGERLSTEQDSHLFEDGL